MSLLEAYEYVLSQQATDDGTGGFWFVRPDKTRFTFELTAPEEYMLVEEKED
jgi:hypothetical protein